MSMALTWKQKDLIEIGALSCDEINSLFAVAKQFKASVQQGRLPQSQLAGRTLVNLFLEPSTRTRLAFEVAAKKLQAEVITISGASSSLTKGESLRDTAQNVAALQADMIIMRHSASGAPNYLSQVVDIPIINGGDGAHAHPTQALLDAFTLKEQLGDIAGKNITILGDILYSRVARSNMECLLKLGAKVTIAGPSTLVPRGFEALGVRVATICKRHCAMRMRSCYCAFNMSDKPPRNFLPLVSIPVCLVSTKSAPNGSNPMLSSCIQAPLTVVLKLTPNWQTRIARSFYSKSPMALWSAWPASTSATPTIMASLYRLNFNDFPSL